MKVGVNEAGITYLPAEFNLLQPLPVVAQSCNKSVFDGNIGS